MPLDAREAIGIIQTFQNMRLGREQAARQTQDQTLQLREYGATAYPGEEEVPAGLAEGAAPGGVTPEMLKGSLSNTAAGQKQKAQGVGDIESYFEQLDAYDTAVRQAEIEGLKNPEMKSIAEAMAKGRGLFESGQRRILNKKRELIPRALTEGTVSEALKTGAKRRIPFAGQ